MKNSYSVGKTEYEMRENEISLILKKRHFLFSHVICINN